MFAMDPVHQGEEGVPTQAEQMHYRCVELHCSPLMAIKVLFFHQIKQCRCIVATQNDAGSGTSFTQSLSMSYSLFGWIIRDQQ